MSKQSLNCLSASASFLTSLPDGTKFSIQHMGLNCLSASASFLTRQCRVKPNT